MFRIRTLLNQLRTRLILGALAFLLALTGAVILVVRDSLNLFARNMESLAAKTLVENNLNDILKVTLLTMGMFIFGISVIRAGVFPPWTGWLVVIGIALFLPAQFQSQAHLFITFWAVGATLLGVGVGWIGWILFRKHDTKQSA
jgi:hypothetical protein